SSATPAHIPTHPNLFTVHRPPSTASRVRRYGRRRRAAGTGFNRDPVAGEGAVILALALAGDPARQVERNRAVSGDPLAVVFARNVYVRAGGPAALARGVANGLAALDEFSSRHAVLGGDVQVQNVPTGGFAAVAIQIE